MSAAVMSSNVMMVSASARVMYVITLLIVLINQMKKIVTNMKISSVQSETSGREN